VRNMLVAHAISDRGGDVVIVRLRYIAKRVKLQLRMVETLAQIRAVKNVGIQFYQNVRGSGMFTALNEVVCESVTIFPLPA